MDPRPPRPDPSRSGAADLFPVIAIDGGAGTGKTTSAAMVARRLGYGYVDSGAIYRAIALGLYESGIREEQDPRVSALAAALPLRIEPSPERFRIFLAGRELSDEIRLPEISSLSSRIAVLATVRQRAFHLMREAGTLGPLVVEGRDIGTVVFPDAILKVHLEAELPERTRRRRLELQAKGRDLPEEDVARDLADRDRRDSGRQEAPLKRAEGALVIDTTNRTIEDQVSVILEAARRALEATRNRP
jgi:CMP/dCMP kinase